MKKLFCLMVCGFVFQSCLGGTLVEKTVSLPPDADAFSNSATPGGDYGSRDDIWIRNWSDGTSMKAYIRFKLPPDLVRSDSATLTLVRTESGRALHYQLYGLKSDSDGQLWRENGGATWLNAPANMTDSGFLFTDAATAVLGSGFLPDGADGDLLTFSSTPELVDFVNSGSARYITLMISQVEDKSSLNRFAALGNKTFPAPQLVLKYISDPDVQMPKLDAAKVDDTGSNVFSYSEQVYSTEAPKMSSGSVKYVNGAIPVLADFSGKDFLIGEFEHNHEIWLMVVNKSKGESSFSISTAPLNLDVYKNSEGDNGLFLLKGVGGFYTVPVSAEGRCLLRFTKTSLADPIGIEARLASRRTAAIRAENPPDLNADPSSWGGVPVPMDWISSETTWYGSDDLSAAAYTLWDADNFYIGAVVHDDEDIILPQFKAGADNVTDTPDREPTDVPVINDIVVRKYNRLGEGQDGAKTGDKVEFSLMKSRISGYRTSTSIVLEKRSWKDGKTFYASAVPWSTLGISNPAEGAWFAFSVLTHDYDENKYNISLWTSGVNWRKNSALLGMIFLAGEKDAENAIEKCTEVVSLNWDKKAIGLNEPLDILITGGWPVGKYTEEIALQILDANKTVVATPAVSGSCPWNAVWTPVDLADGTYTVVANLNVKGREKTITRKIELRDAAKTETGNLIRQAEAGYNQSCSQMSEMVTGLSKQSLGNARQFYALGNFDIAKDSAQQVLAWCDRKTYDVPVPAVDTASELKTVSSTPEHNREIAVWETDGCWCASNNAITLKVSKDTLDIEVAHAAHPATAWETSGDSEDLVFSTADGLKRAGLADARLKKGYRSIADSRGGTGLEIHVADFPQIPNSSDDVVKIEVMLYPDSPEFTVTLLPTAASGRNKLVEATYPHSVRLSRAAGNYAAIPVYGGCIVPTDWSSAINLNFDGIFWVTPTWLTFVRPDGALLFYPETPYDMGLRFNYNPRESIFGKFAWKSCWGELRYPRRMRYVVQPGGDYVTASKRFRTHAKDVGFFRSLRDKIAETPSIKSRIGAPVILTGLYSTLERDCQGKFRVTTWDNRIQVAGRLADRGLKKAYVHHTQWQSMLPSSNGTTLFPSYGTYFPVNEFAGGWEGISFLSKALEEKGWSLGLYSNFIDYDPGSPLWDEASAKKGTTGLSVRRRNPAPSSSFISERVEAEDHFVSKFYKKLMSGGLSSNALNQIYMDVFCAVPLHEDYDPRHPMTREQAAFYERACMNEARSLGLTVICEHKTDWAVPTQDAAWQIMPPAYGIAVPLFNLVYHDALIAPYALTELDHKNWLMCLLYGQVPRIGFNPSDELLRWVQLLCKVNTQVAEAEMVSHRFVDDTMSIQEAIFSNGVTIRVDLGNYTYRITGVPSLSDAEQKIVL